MYITIENEKIQISSYEQIIDSQGARDVIKISAQQTRQSLDWIANLFLYRSLYGMKIVSENVYEGVRHYSGVLSLVRTLGESDYILRIELVPASPAEMQKYFESQAPVAPPATPPAAPAAPIAPAECDEPEELLVDGKPLAGQDVEASETVEQEQSDNKKSKKH